MIMHHSQFMASKSLIPIICFLLSCQCLILASLANSHKNSSQGLTLELIPPHSPKSPLFKTNVSFAERSHWLLQHSHARAKYISSLVVSNCSGSNCHKISAPVVPLLTPQSTMVVSVGIGTFRFLVYNGSRPKGYFLLMDTSSELTWTQCEDCKLEGQGKKCYPQMDYPFQNHKSKSYKPLPCSDARCSRPQNCTNEDYCSYFVEYMDGADSSGTLATETFTLSFNSSPLFDEAVPEIVFGCGDHNSDPKAKDWSYPIAGVFGLGQGDLSFVQQLGQRIGDGSFSYCLISYKHREHAPTNYLRFGSAIKPTKDLQTVDFYKNGEFKGYFVNLEDLGVGGKRLNISPNVFGASPDDGKLGGCVVDTGTAFSHIVKDAYDVLVKGLDEHFSNSPEFTRIYEGERVCYGREKEQGYTPNIPSIEFYFEQEGAHLSVSAGEVFSETILKHPKMEVFCLNVYPDENATILGAAQQVNTKFVYDTKSKKLQFGPEDCAKNG